MKSRKIDANDIASFQPELANALFDLNVLYRSIAQEKKRLVRRKARFLPEWFSKRMANLAYYQKAINQAIAIGKGIGDAFAWFFYRRDRAYLREHLSQEEVFHAPPGLGGIGELEFAKSIRLLHGYFVIHHNTTSILRLGDVSLIDLSNFSVAGIGELKTSPVAPGELRLELLYSGPGIDMGKISEDIAHRNLPKSKKPFMHGFPDNARARMERQIKRISRSYDALDASPEHLLRIESNDNLGALTRAYKLSKCGEFHFQKASRGLAIGVYRERKKRLSAKLLPEKGSDVSSKLDGVEDCASKLLNTDRNDNSLTIGLLYYNEKGKVPHLPGMMHLFWWPIKPEILKSIVFMDAMVVTLFNPAQLAATFENAGYEVQCSGRYRYRIYKEYGGRTIQIEGFPLYCRMIAEYLFAEDAVLDLVNRVEESLKDQELSGPVRIDLQIMQEF